MDSENGILSIEGPAPKPGGTVVPPFRGDTIEDARHCINTLFAGDLP